MASDRQGNQGVGALGESGNQILNDARVFSALSGIEPEPELLRAYVAGARGLLQYYEQFHRKVEQDIDANKSTDWERGQLDGVRWVGDYLRNLFGL